MSQVYNTQGDIANNLGDFFNSIYTLTKPQTKILHYIIEGMLESESVVTHDIIKKLKGDFSLVKNEYNQRRLRRFFNSDNFDIYMFYDAIIKYVITNYRKKYADKRLNISIDHTFCKDKYSIISFSMRIGRQAIPIWWRCLK